MIFVHVGLPKVGSTTIQHFLSLNGRLLARHGYAYPRLVQPGEMDVGAKSHNALGIELHRGARGMAWHRLRAAVARLPQGDNVILSAETLAGCGPASLKAALQATFGDRPVRIVLYARSFTEMLPSRYAHQAKLGITTVNFDHYFKRIINHESTDLPAMAKQWTDVFGLAALRLRMLDSKVLVRGDLCFDFLDSIGIDTSDLSPQDLVLPGVVNPALGWKTVEILRDLYGSMLGLRSRPSRAGLRAARRARKQREGSPFYDLAAGMSHLAETIGTEMGFSDRGHYLSLEQIGTCVARFNAQVGLLHARGIDTNFRPVSAAGLVPRSFLPESSRIPTGERAAFLARLAPAGLFYLLSGERPFQAGQVLPPGETPVGLLHGG